MDYSGIYSQLSFLPSTQPAFWHSTSVNSRRARVPSARHIPEGFIFIGTRVSSVPYPREKHGKREEITLFFHRYSPSLSLTFSFKTLVCMHTRTHHARTTVTTTTNPPRLATCPARLSVAVRRGLYAQTTTSTHIRPSSSSTLRLRLSSSSSEGQRASERR